jgi:hypothetical protein
MTAPRQTSPIDTRNSVISDFLSPEQVAEMNAATEPLFAATKSTSQQEQRLVEMGPDVRTLSLFSDAVSALSKAERLDPFLLPPSPFFPFSHLLSLDASPFLQFHASNTTHLRGMLGV